MKGLSSIGMFSALFLVLLLALLSPSCRKSVKYSSDPVADFSPLPLKASGGRRISDGEFANAVQVCLSYRKKSVNFRRNLMRRGFKFFVRLNKCDGSVRRGIVETHLRAPASDGSMVYGPSGEADNLRYISSVETHESGFLSQICPRIIKGEHIPNPSVISLKGGKSAELTFFTGGKPFQYRVRHLGEVIPSSQMRTVEEIVSYHVETNEKNFGDRVGLVTKVERVAPCSAESVRREILTQVYLGER